jgi:LPXTG-motif cell wall-anchored protein
MKASSVQLRSAAGLLVAASILPLAPLLAQDTAPAEDPPAAEAPAQPKAKAEPASPAEKAAPATEPANPVTIPAPQAPAAVPDTPVRSAPRVAVTAPAPAPSVQSGNLPPLAPPIGETAGIPAPSPEAGLTTEVLPEPEPVRVEPLQPEQAAEGGMSPLPFLLAGALLVAALALFLLRRRRRVHSVIHERAQERSESLTAALAREPMAVPPRAAPLAATPAAAPVAAAPVAAAAVEEGRPDLDLALRAIRAGVTGGEAQVEFELIVENRGSATAHDLRVSTFLFASGPGQESAIERMLVERAEHGEAELPRTDLEAGMGKRIEASVELSTANVEGGSVLPVVVAEARYRLPGGVEERKSAFYAVGLPDGEELAHFATDNPSGLHEGVEARPLG